MRWTVATLSEDALLVIAIAVIRSAMACSLLGIGLSTPLGFWKLEALYTRTSFRYRALCNEPISADSNSSSRCSNAFICLTLLGKSDRRHRCLTQEVCSLI